MIKLVVKETADNDVDCIISYLKSNAAEDAARKLWDKIYAQYENLILFPLSGTKVKLKRLSRYRFCLVENYYVFYTYKDSVLSVERVLHTARNIKPILNGDFPV